RQHAGGIAKGWMRRTVASASAVDPELAAVAEPLEELLARERPCDPAAHTSSFQAAPAAFSGGHSRAHLGGDQVEQLQPAPAVVAPEVDHQMGETDALILAEEIRDRLRPLPDQVVGEGEPQRDRDRWPRTLGGVGRGAKACDPVAHLGRCLARRVPAIAELDNPAKRARAVAADPDRRMRLLHRLRGKADVVEAVELAVEGRAIRGPELLEDPEHLVGL